MKAAASVKFIARPTHGLNFALYELRSHAAYYGANRLDQRAIGTTAKIQPPPIGEVRKFIVVLSYALAGQMV
jgi:hypothetical protein